MTMSRADRRAAWGAMALLWTLPLAAWFSTTAKADPSTPVAVYAAKNADTVCEVIAKYPSVDGVTGVVSAVMEDGNFTAYESGQVVGLAVSVACPEFWPVLQRFVDYYSADPNQTYVASGHLGGVLE